MPTTLGCLLGEGSSVLPSAAGLHESRPGLDAGPGCGSTAGPRITGLCPQMEVSSDAEHFHVHAQEHKVLQFAHRHRPLAAITRVQVLSDHRLAQVELARRSLSWG
nr:PREDICTED: grifin-like [Equus przewalskii]